MQVKQTTTTKLMTLAELNEKAQEIANKLGHIPQELLLEVHTLLHKKDECCKGTNCTAADEAAPTVVS